MKIELLILIIILMTISSCANEEITFDSLEKFVLYNVDGIEAFKLSKNEITNLEKFNYKEEDVQKIKNIFLNGEFKNKFLLWKGSLYGIATLKDNSSIEIAISLYGGFFKIKNNKKIFILPENSRKDWENLLLIGRTNLKIISG